MRLTIESASGILSEMGKLHELNNNKIQAEAIEVALECMRKIEDQKLSDYIKTPENESIKKLVDSALPFLMAYHLACLSVTNGKEINVLKGMLSPLKEIVEYLELLEK